MSKQKNSPSPSQRHSERREYYIGDPGFEREYAQPKPDDVRKDQPKPQSTMSHDISIEDYENEMFFGRSGLERDTHH